LKASAAGVGRTEQVARIEPPGPAGACHRAGQRPDPVGRPDDKLREIRDRPINVHRRPRVSLSLNPGYSTVAALAAGEWESQNGISAIVI